MAETLVNFVLGKLCDAVFQEVAFLCGVNDKAELVKRHLTRIQCFLRDADRKRGGDDRVRNWVNELRDVSFCIEDAVDTFLVEVDKLESEKPGVIDKIKKKNKGVKGCCISIIRKPKKVVAVHQFGVELDKILARIEEITKSRETYRIEDLGESSTSVPVRPPILPDLDETELIGFGADKETIIERLLDEKILRRSVVSIVGSGGLGKTTLAQKAYSSDAVKSRFNVCMWLDISQNFKLIDLLKKMLQNVREIKDNEKDREATYFMTEINNFLREKKYLIVMDDVWSNNLWSQILPALPNVRNGSRVLITSRFYKIAKAADPQSTPYELRFLNEEESLQLFLKIALPGLDANNDPPTNVLDIAKKMVEICDGLPLALIVLGGLLSVKPQTRDVWEKVLKTMVWGIEGKECMDILSTTYDDMPALLKSCFMYLACFPEDYEINARILIRLWVAEGFITEEPRRTLEDTAENYLEQLAERYMVRVLRRHSSGSIKSIRIHDILRELAISKAKEDNLITVFSNNDGTRTPGTVPRRAALQSFSTHQLEAHTGPKLRSLHCFNGQLADCSSYKMLKVCNMDNCGRGNTDYNKIGLVWTIQLRFLRFSSGTSNLVPFADHSKNLQTFDLEECHITDVLPESFWGIKTLRHVILDDLATIHQGPPPRAKLENLQTLKNVTVSDSWKDGLPKLTNLRRLKLLQGSCSVATIVSLFQTLKNLVSLSFIPGHAVDFPLEVIDMQGFPFYDRLQSLELKGVRQNLDLQIAMFPPNLTKLHLSHCDLDKDPMPMLGRLQSLKKLSLSEFASGETMMCSAGQFPCLETLELNSLHYLVVLKIEEGAMPNIKIIKIVDCEEFSWLPMHLTCHLLR